jgi:hypothetical protein
VSADGKRILTFQYVSVSQTGAGAAAGDTGGVEPPLSITVAMNWTAGLKK